ncbi:uncharacterized protein PV09_06484 [Verruconis gallopava]|uniref:RNA-binding S4 domain-containing protein n=1 Tax=Verruconis gallopava TaxID=253628 RepID=A0A0D2A6H9_9PEZI|nr:uncharacterized protein PV09_06484 [Verruconis gallopava]KIW02343.1 hypothetical protein PV09_06484 [Verruconis gallopava]
MVRKNYRELYRKGRILQSWRGINLYNLAHYRDPFLKTKTLYQQKWLAKSHSRTYHGHQVREKQWKLQFNRKIPAVVEMDIERLAKDDGSRQAAGRGTGKDDPQWMIRRRPRNTPYMSMTYWPLERRLDTAIFRALFASSIRTARQFVLHGHVKVNGRKIKHPGYLLNPGDMFSVDPEMVMYSTGMKESASTRKWIYNNLPADAPKDLLLAKPRNQKTPADEAVAEAAPEAEAGATTEVAGDSALTEEDNAAMSVNKLKAELKRLEEKISEYLRPQLGKGYVFRSRRKKRLYKLRELRRQVRAAIKASSAESDEAAAKQVKSFAARLDRSKVESDVVKKHLEQLHPPPESRAPPITHLELLKSWPNARLQDKPYLTPWVPRNWMSAFAFIPRYLEVNQNVCSAVYLRHPVARQGLAEVPSPFSKEMGLLSYHWYLRRR